MDFQPQIQFLTKRSGVITLAIPDVERGNFLLFNSEQKILYLCDSSFWNPCVTQYYISYAIYSIPSLHGYTVTITREILGSFYKHFEKKKKGKSQNACLLQLSAWDINFILNKNFFNF